MHRVRLTTMDVQLPGLNAERERDQGFGVRVAAIGDLHVRGTEDQRQFPRLSNLAAVADLLVVAGDLTENGRMLEAEAVADLLSTARLPVIAVLGNHDLRTLRRAAFRRVLERRGIEVLDGNATVIHASNGFRVGIAGATGSGGGFWLQEGPDAIRTRTFKRLAIRVSRECAALERALLTLETDVRIATTHFAPTTSTLGREPLAKYWMLGNCELGVVLDRCKPDLVFHGHAHLGTLKGQTPGGVPVRNVALPVVRKVHLETLELAPVAHSKRDSFEPTVHWS
jgi:Icc-related predicted phosphoesterase